MKSYLTRELLELKKADLAVQRDNAVSVFNQAVGAIALIDNLLPLLDSEKDDSSPEPPEEKG